MKSNIHKKRPERRFSVTAFSTALLAALLLFAGCKDFFHPEGPEGSKDDSTYYTVTFNADGGTPATQTRTVNGSGSVGSSMPSNPTKSGNAFGGWYTSRSGGGSQFTSSTTVTSNITVYAKWTANASTQYTITFNADGGTPTTQTRTVNGGGSVGSSMPSNPIMSGYAFDGWYTSRNGGGSQFTSSTTVTSNITLYAKWMILANILVYELTQNPNYDNYTADIDDFLPDGFAVHAGDRIEISFLIKTDTTIPNFSVAIADWTNNGDWIAMDWDAAKSVTADGQFHWCSWILTAQASGPAGAAPLRTQFSMATASVPVVTIYVSDVTVTKLSY